MVYPHWHARCVGELLLLIGTVLGSIATPHPARAQGICTAVHCLWAPLAASYTPVRISDASYASLSDRMEVTGELEAAQQPVYDIRLQVRIFGPSDTLLQTVVITPTFAATLPGQTNPYEQPVAVCCMPRRVEVTLLSWATSSPRTYVTLPVTQLVWTSEQFAVSVHNDRSVTLHNVAVAVRELYPDVLVGRVGALGPGKTFVFAENAPDPLGFRFNSWAQATLQP